MAAGRASALPWLLCEREQGAGCDRQGTGAVVNSSSANPSSGGGKDNIPATKRRNSSLILLLSLLRGLDQGQPRQRDPEAQELSAEKKKEYFAQNEVSSPRKEMTRVPKYRPGLFFSPVAQKRLFPPNNQSNASLCLCETCSCLTLDVISWAHSTIMTMILSKKRCKQDVTRRHFGLTPNQDPHPDPRQGRTA